MKTTKMWMLSTAHLSKKAAKWLNARLDINLTSDVPYQTDLYIHPKYSLGDHTGYLIEILSEPQDNTMPKSLKHILKYATKKGCWWIDFDSIYDTDDRFKEHCPENGLPEPNREYFIDSK